MGTYKYNDGPKAAIMSVNNRKNIGFETSFWWSGLKHGYFVIRWSLPIILLGMILARMVWMQQRNYPIVHRVPALATQLKMSIDRPAECSTGGTSESSYPLAKYGEDLRPVLGFAEWSLVDGLADKYFGILCSRGGMAPINLTRFNQWLWVGVVLTATMSLRFVSGSWLLPLVAATALMSRGDLMSQIGNLSGSVAEMLAVALWYCCMVHFMRSGSAIVYSVGTAAAIFGALFSPVLGFLLLAMPMMLLAGKAAQRIIGNMRLNRPRRRLLASSSGQEIASDDVWAQMLDYSRRVLGLSDDQDSHYPTEQYAYRRRSRLFSTTGSSFAVWIFREERWSRLALIGASLFLMLMLLLVARMLLGLNQAEWPQLEVVAPQLIESLGRISYTDYTKNFDFHFIISCIVLLVSAVQSPVDGLTCFFESVWLLIFSTIMLLFGALLITWFFSGMALLPGLTGGDFATVIGEPLRYVSITVEALIIAFGIGGIYNLIKAADSMFSRISE
jgi:hypothetical protein